VLAESDKSLFREETVEEDGKNREVLVSSLLDAMDAANFW